MPNGVSISLTLGRMPWSLFGKQYELGARQLALGTAHYETVTLARTLRVS